jgi:hypothetical protein
MRGIELEECKLSLPCTWSSFVGKIVERYRMASSWPWRLKVPIRTKTKEKKEMQANPRLFPWIALGRFGGQNRIWGGNAESA